MFNFESAALGDFALASGGLGQNVLAVVAGDHGLGVAEDHGGLAASSAPNIHEVGVGAGHQSLQLVGLSLVLDGGVQQVSVHLWMPFIINNQYLILIYLTIKLIITLKECLFSRKQDMLVKFIR